MLLKKKRVLNILLMIYKFLLILIEKILMKKILMKKILMRKILMKKILMKEIKKYFFIAFFLHLKMVNKYYQKHKEKLEKEAW